MQFVWYGRGFFGLNSIVTLAAIACERYRVIISCSCRPTIAKWRITHSQVRKVINNVYNIYNKTTFSRFQKPTSPHYLYSYNLRNVAQLKAVTVLHQ